MRRFFALWLAAGCAFAGAPFAKAERNPLTLAIESQNILNEYALSATEPEAMKYAQRLRLTKAVLDAQVRQWPDNINTAEPLNPFRSCKSALVKASYLAGLSGMKATSAVDDKVFNSEKSQLRQLRAECNSLIKRSNQRP